MFRYSSPSFHYRNKKDIKSSKFEMVFVWRLFFWKYVPRALQKFLRFEWFHRLCLGQNMHEIYENRVKKKFKKWVTVYWEWLCVDERRGQEKEEKKELQQLSWLQSVWEQYTADVYCVKAPTLCKSLILKKHYVLMVNILHTCNFYIIQRNSE